MAFSFGGAHSSFSEHFRLCHWLCCNPFRISVLFLWSVVARLVSGLLPHPFRATEPTGASRASARAGIHRLIWQKHPREIESGGKLPLVVPVVIHPGPGNWSAVRRLRDLVEIPAEISDWATAFVPDCGFLLVELAGLPLEKLADGRLARAMTGALQSESAGGMKFQEVERIFAEIFA